MRKNWILLTTGALMSCGQPAEQPTANRAAPKKEKPAHCFFKETETKGWAAKRGRDGNITVTGKAYRSDSRYKAVMLPPKITGTSAELTPTITLNGDRYGAPDDWWTVTSTIPNSSAIETVTVRCGSRTLAEIKLPPGKH